MDGAAGGTRPARGKARGISFLKVTAIGCRCYLTGWMGFGEHGWAEAACPAASCDTVPPHSPCSAPPPPPALPQQFKPAPGPIMAPTRKRLLAPLPSSKITKAEQRAEGRVARLVYLTYFR